MWSQHSFRTTSPVEPTTRPEAFGAGLCALPPLRRCYDRAPFLLPSQTAVASPERTTGRCQPCGKGKREWTITSFFSLSCGDCTPPFELTPIRVCTCTSYYRIYTKCTSVPLASVMPLSCAVSLSRPWYLGPLMRCSDVGPLSVPIHKTRCSGIGRTS